MRNHRLLASALRGNVSGHDVSFAFISHRSVDKAFRIRRLHPPQLLT